MPALMRQAGAPAIGPMEFFSPGGIMDGRLRQCDPKRKWSERQDSNLRRLAPKASALARLSYAPTTAPSSLRMPPGAMRILAGYRSLLDAVAELQFPQWQQSESNLRRKRAG